MAGNLRSRRWLAIGLVIAFGFALVALLPGCGGEDSSEEQRAREPEPAGSPEGTPRPGVRVQAGDVSQAARRIAEGCEPAEEARKYEDFVGSRAMAVLHWTGMSEDSADLEIPVYVVGIEDGAIRVRFLQFPMREQYLHIWLGSGHIQAAPENVFLLQSCSAALGPGPDAGREPTE